MKPSGMLKNGKNDGQMGEKMNGVIGNWLTGKGRKSQMEILGIAVIVVFLALGIFFVVKFNVFSTPSGTRDVYTQSELSSSVVSAIISTTTPDCKNANVRQLLIDCAANFYYGGSIICKTEDDHDNLSCEYVNQTLNHLLNITLDSWSKNYIFNVTTALGTEPQVVYSKVGGSCIGSRMASQFFFPTGTGGTLLLKLDVCD
jgi:hypothetical protein